MTTNTDITPKLATGIVVIVLFFGLVALFCTLLVRLYRRRTADYYREKLEHQKQLSEATLESQRQLMAILARDFHDDIGQQLTVLNFGIERLRLDAPQEESMWAGFSVSLSKASEAVRMISHTLGSLAESDLPEAIRSEAMRIQSYSGIAVRVEAPEGQNWQETEKVVLYRIFQECVNNALKHAEARTISIELEQEPIPRFRFCDDGRGFDVDAVERHSFGLDSMTSRALRAGYSLSIESSLGHGTCITATKMSNNE